MYDETEQYAKRLAEIRQIIERVDLRAAAADGPVTPTLQEMTQEEISRIYALAGGTTSEDELPPLFSYEQFCEFRDEAVPALLAAGWSIDPEPPRVPNPISSDLPPLRLQYQNPEDRLYYGLKDAVRKLIGKQPRRPGVPKDTEP